MQIFGSSPRQWEVRLPAAGDVKDFLAGLKDSGVRAVYLHAPYLPNLASPNMAVVKKSVNCLSAHMQIAQSIGAKGLVVHVGSGNEKLSKEEAIERASLAIKEVLKKSPGSAWFIIENTAGGGQKLGADEKEIGKLMRRVGSKRVKACFDTAHAFEAGLIKKFSPQEIGRVFSSWDEEVGLENLVAVHANDSKTEFNSKHDRHENIGEGRIGKSAFANLLKEKSLAHTHWMLEVPGFDGMGPDKKNLDILKKLRKT